MNAHFSGLTTGELERLAYLAEEMAECIQAVNKIIRHGYASFNPDNVYDGTNRQQLERELADVGFAIGLLGANKDIDYERVNEIVSRKGEHSLRYFHHQPPYRGHAKI